MPAVHGDRVVFICEDDLWEVPRAGGRAIRLTSSVAELSWPAFSHDGSQIALISKEEGNTDVYVMPSMGGQLTRLTYDHVAAHVVGWSEDGSAVRFASNRRSPHRAMELFEVSSQGGQPESLHVGEGVFINTHRATGRRVLGRYNIDNANWKRYRGGTAADIWIERDGEGDWHRLLPQEDAGRTRPLWIGDRVYFCSDRDGHGNLYSCLEDGTDITRHTDHVGFYVRSAQTDGTSIVYDCGGDLYCFDVARGESKKIEVELYSARTQRSRKFVDASDYAESYALHPKGHHALLVSRGKPFSFGLWEGAVRQHGEAQGARYRLSTYDSDGASILSTSDVDVTTGEEHLVRLRSDRQGEERLELSVEGSEHGGLGRLIGLEVSPTGERLAILNHRHELFLVDLTEQRATRIARSERERIEDIAWSPDGAWLAYALPLIGQTSKIMLYHLESGEHTEVTTGEFADFAPTFDPKGRYLYFASYRAFDPIYGNLFFELGLQRGHLLCLVTLDASARSPFLKTPRPFGEEDDEEEKEDESEDEVGGEKKDGKASDARAGEEEVAEKEGGKKASADPVKIDLDGIAERVMQFPLREMNITQIAATEGRVYFLTTTPKGSLERGQEEAPGGVLRFWSLEDHKAKVFHRRVSSFTLSMNGEALALWAEEGLRVLAASAQPPEEDDEEEEEFSRKSGWIDLDRLAVEVDPGREWRQMFAEIWRLMRDDFWRADMSGVDWEEAYTRYAPLVERVASRKEFSNIVWMMQGELGTSHAYEFGGDYRVGPSYWPGRLGAEFRWDASARTPAGEEGELSGGYRITRIVRGDVWRTRAGSPLAKPGVRVKEGDVLVAIDGVRLSDPHESVDARLLNKARREVALTVYTPGEEATREVVVRTLQSQSALYYRDWVRSRRELVREASGGRLGYVHVPDMGPEGYAEFHRGFAAERAKPGLIVDVRFNGGGHVSQLILEKLSRRPLGFDVMRYGEANAYPMDGPGGPVVAVTNAYAGSDGDIFSHGFKMLKLGPLVGVRTWGGVIGIWPRHALVDGSVTTQPSYSFWFKDVGFGLENRGVEPDVEIHETPRDQAEGVDVQLERAIALALERLDTDGSRYRPPQGGFAPYPGLGAPRHLPKT